MACDLRKLKKKSRELQYEDGWKRKPQRMTSLIFRVIARSRRALVASAWLAGFGTGGFAVAETYVSEPTPPGVRVERSELEGPVYADADGKTLYKWHVQLPGGGREDTECSDEPITISHTTGDQSIYPVAILPESENRPSCAEVWPPMLAAQTATPIGRWSIVNRANGQRQWAYDGFPLSTSIFDEQPGDVFGGTSRADGIAFNTGPNAGFLFPAYDRIPISPPAQTPPGFEIVTTAVGRLLTTKEGYTVYTSADDPPGESRCDTECAEIWRPLMAPQLAQARGDWSIIARGMGVRQWAYRGKPLYSYSHDRHRRGLSGTEVPGWRAAILQQVPRRPSWVSIQESAVGPLYADQNGKTLYIYSCTEPSLDELPCDHPDTTQFYRLAMCGNGDPKLCLKTWPLVEASADAESSSRTWRVITIDPLTGRYVDDDDPAAKRVWSFRGRPLYTYVDDEQPGDAWGDGIGEFFGSRNGFTAFRVRGSELYPPGGAD